MMQVQNRAAPPMPLQDTWSRDRPANSHTQAQGQEMSPPSSSPTSSPTICPTLARDSVVSTTTPIRTPSTAVRLEAGQGLSYFEHTPYAQHENAAALFAFPTPQMTRHRYISPSKEQQPNFSPYNAYDQSMIYNQPLQVGITGWTPGSSSTTLTHVNPQLMEATPSRSLSPESVSEANFSPISPDEKSPNNISAPKPNPSSADEWYDGPSRWIRCVAEAHRQRRMTYLADPKAWPKSEGVPKVLQPLTDPCRYPHLWEVEEARKGQTEEMVVSKLTKKTEATISKEFARCQKAGEEFKAPRPMNSAMAFADFRRPQWGDMYGDMKTGAISTWLSAEWRALKDFKPDEFEWWTRVAKRYWDKYVQDYDYKFTRAPNGEGKGSKKKKAKAKENAPREKTMRLSAEAAQRASLRGARKAQRPRGRSGIPPLAPPMTIPLPDQNFPMSLHPSPNTLGLSGLSQLSPTNLMTGSVPCGTPCTPCYSDGITYFDASRTPSPPEPLNPLEAQHQHPTHSYSPGYFYPTVTQADYVYQQPQQQPHHQWHQHPTPQQSQAVLQVGVVDNTGLRGSSYQAPWYHPIVS